MIPIPSLGSGTEWVVPGRGSSVAELLDALGEGSTCPGEWRVKTDLLLTGRLLDQRDRDRIREAVAQARRRAAGSEAQS